MALQAVGKGWHQIVKAKEIWRRQPLALLIYLFKINGFVFIKLTDMPGRIRNSFYFPVDETAEVQVGHRLSPVLYVHCTLYSILYYEDVKLLPSWTYTYS